MRRVLILGSPGAGKSTLARSLAAQTGLPLVHLDQLYWRANWVEPEAAEWQNTLREAIAQDAWILDGNYGNSVAMRLARADTVILLDYPRWICLLRILKRVLLGWGKVREDMPAGCPERFDPEFLRFVWHFRDRQRPALIAALAGFEGTAVILRTPRQACKFSAKRMLRLT